MCHGVETLSLYILLTHILCSDNNIKKYVECYKQLDTLAVNMHTVWSYLTDYSLST